MSQPLDRLAEALHDHYTIERELGAGGMATVYLADDRRHHRKVAVKVLRPDLAATLGPDRFLREVTIAANLQHPHILPVYDSGEVEGFLYYVMPFVEGESLRDRLAKHGELPISDAVRALRDVADAMAAAHAKGVVHRDIKPENIMLSGRHALVADFGVAKAVSEATGRQQLTTTGVALGTPIYMAPEQAAADPHMDHRADIYAFGVMAYEILTGQPPFVGATPQAVLAAHVTETPVAVTQRRAAIPQPLAQLVMRCLAKKPADRPQSSEELLTVLEGLSTLSGGITPAQTQPVTGARPRRARVWTASGAVAVVAAAGAAWLLLRPHGPDPLDRERVLISVLDNRTGDAALDHIGSEAADWVTRGIARAGIVEVVSATAMLETLRDLEGREEGIDARGLARAAARENDAGTLVSGAYYRAGDSIRIEAEIIDPTTGSLLSPLEPVNGAVEDPTRAFEALSQRVMGALATMLDPRLADYATATTQPPKYEAYKLFMEGLEHYLRVDYRPAIELFARSSALDSTFMLPPLQAAAAYGNLGDRAREDSLLQIVSRHRESLTPYDAHYLDANMANVRGDLAARFDAWRRRVELAPGSGRDLYGAGFSANALNRPTEALEYLLRVDPDRGWVRGWTPYWAELTWAYHMLGRYDEELEAAQRGMVQHGNLRVMVHELRALAALGRLGDLDARLETVYNTRTSGSYDPGYVLLLTGLELGAHGHVDAAARALGHAIEWYDSRPAAEQAVPQNRSRLVGALAAAGRWERAASIADSLNTEFPENLTYLCGRGIVAAQRGDSIEAARVAERLRTLDRPYLNGSNTYCRAAIAAALGESDQAVRLLRDAVREGTSVYGYVHQEPAFETLRDYPPCRELMRPQG